MVGRRQGAALVVAWWVAALAGCVVPADVGQACEAFVVNEVAFSNSDIGMPVSETPTDYVELAPAPGYDGIVNLDGYVVYNADGSLGTTLGASAQMARGDPLRPSFTVLLTTQYDYPPGCTPDPPDGGADTCTHVLGFDFNNDGAEFEILAPTARPGLFASCVRVFVPDAHKNFSWQPRGDGTWCFAESTPGRENARCLCDASDEC